MPRYVILEHDHPVLHWDFMLEDGAALKTWRLLSPPRPGAAIAAEALPDHRPLYLDYEGPVSGNRGRVRRWDWGTYEWETPPNAEGGEVAVRLRGKQVTGLAVLARSGGAWSFTLAGRS